MMVTRMAWALAVLVLAQAALADEPLADRWDKPQRESFDMKGALPEHVVEEIRKRYDVLFGVEATDLKRGDFVARDVTLFEALDRFAAAHAIHLAGVPTPPKDDWETGLKLVRTEPAMPPTPSAYVGPSRFSVECVSAVVVQRCAPALGVPDELLESGLYEEEMPRLRVRLRWLVEPGFEEAKLIEWTCAEAFDDLGTRCVPFSNEFAQAVPANSRFLLELRPPRPGAKKLTRVEVTARIALPAARQEIAFDAGEVGTTKKLGGARITFVKLDGTAARFVTEGSLDGESRSAMIIPASQRGDMGDAVLRAYTEGGVEIEATPVISLQQLDSANLVCMQGVDLAQAPKRIVLSAVTQVAVREASVVFTDVALPR